MNEDNSHTAIIIGICAVVACACLATHSADPLWILLFLLWVL